jgi:hypothetical protein
MKHLALIALLLAPPAVLHAADVPQAGPNVVFILADDLGWGDTTLYGRTKFCETPNIERLAQRGMKFANAYAANPLCSPTRASMPWVRRALRSICRRWSNSTRGRLSCWA